MNYNSNKKYSNYVNRFKLLLDYDKSDKKIEIILCKYDVKINKKNLSKRIVKKEWKEIKDILAKEKKEIR